MPQNKAASGGQHRQAPPAGHSQPNGYPMRQRQLHNAAQRKRTPPTRQVMPERTRIHIRRAQRSEVREKPCSQKRGNRALPRLAAWRSVLPAQTRPSRPIAGNWLTHSGMESQKRRQQRDQRAAGCRCKPGPAPAKAGGHQVSALPSELERWGNKQGAVLMVMCKLSTARNGPSRWSGPSIEPAAR